jgi:hypothetical protein
MWFTVQTNMFVTPVVVVVSAEMLLKEVCMYVCVCVYIYIYIYIYCLNVSITKLCAVVRLSVSSAWVLK